MKNSELNLVVIRAADIEQLSNFYSLLGCVFKKHKHGGGPEHYTYETESFIFEIYPALKKSDKTNNLRLGFRVESVDEILERIKASGFVTFILSDAQDSQWGRRAVINDPEGHKVELIDDSPKVR